MMADGLAAALQGALLVVQSVSWRGFALVQLAIELVPPGHVTPLLLGLRLWFASEFQADSGRPAEPGVGHHQINCLNGLAVFGAKLIRLLVDLCARSNRWAKTNLRALFGNDVLPVVGRNDPG
jgi:hypothetical protein